MNRVKLFLENFLAYGFINILNKIIPLLLLPVITRMLSDPSDFGIYDMYNTIIGFGSPLVMLGMYDAMFREYFEREDEQYRYDVTSTTNRIVITTSIIGSLVLIIFNTSFSNVFFGTPIYGVVVVLSAIEMLITTNNSIVAAPTRIQNKRKLYIFSGLLSSVSYYMLAIVLLYFGYSFFGMIYANLVSSIVLLVFFIILNKDYFILGSFNKKIARELLKIGLPLVPTFLIYWIYNSMDKLMITNILGATALGMYSIGSRFASISSLVYAAFTGGWQYFSFSTMKDRDQVSLNSYVFEYLGVVSFLSLIFIYPLITPVFNLLFPDSYSGGTYVIPYLYLSPLLLMIFQVVGNQFIIIKKSYWSTITLSVGAIANIIFNWYLIPILGIEGAALATLIGYTLSVVIVSIIAIKMELHLIPKRFLVSSLVVSVYIIIVRMFFFEMIGVQVLLSFICMFIYFCLYKKELNIIYKKVNSLFIG